MIVVNFKNYVFGRDALDLARKLDIYCNKMAIACVPYTEIENINKGTDNLPIYAQHVDHFAAERATGFVPGEAIKGVGALGSILNHSEHPVSLEIIKKTIERCNELGLKLIVCAATVREAKKILELKPYALAFEDPALVASGKSITQYKADEVSKFTELFKESDVIPLCGAGISNIDDVKRAFELGCKGILISSAITKAKNPVPFLMEFSQLYAKKE